MQRRTSSYFQSRSSFQHPLVLPCTVGIQRVRTLLPQCHSEIIVNLQLVSSLRSVYFVAVGSIFGRCQYTPLTNISAHYAFTVIWSNMVYNDNRYNAVIFLNEYSMLAINANRKRMWIKRLDSYFRPKLAMKAKICNQQCFIYKT